MTAAFSGVSAIRAIVFDAYGTLFDVHSAVQRHAGPLGQHAQAVSDLWRTKQLEYSWTRSLMGRYQDFWSLTGQALDFALARFGVADAVLRADLLDAYRTLSAYSEVSPVLAALKAQGFKTAILSNGSPQMLSEAVASAGIGALLDAVLSVHELSTFKPPPAAYVPVGKALGATPEQVLFVSSNRWDVAGATAFGFASVWCNRSGFPDEYTELAPVAVVRDLTGIAEFLRS